MIVKLYKNKWNVKVKNAGMLISLIKNGVTTLLYNSKKFYCFRITDCRNNWKDAYFKSYKETTKESGS